MSSDDEASFEILGPPIGYTDLLDYAITNKLAKEKEDRHLGNSKRMSLRPSSAGACARKLAYDLMEDRGHAWYDFPPVAPNVFRLFDLGHVIESITLKHFQLVKIFQQKYKQQILTFFPLERGLEGLKKEILEGSCDFVLWSEKYKAIGDVKSKKDKFSAAYKSSWDEELERFSHMDSLVALSETAFYANNLDELLEELGQDDWLCDNLYQLNLYAHSDFIRARGVDHCFLYRYNKNDSRHMELRFRPSKKAFDYVQQKFNAVCQAVDKKDPKLVEQEFFLGSARCAFCDAKAQCYGDDDAMRNYFNTLPKKSWPTDLSKIDPTGKLKGYFETYEQLIDTRNSVEAYERLIAKELLDLEETKIRHQGRVYELKFLKTPQPHYELRRAK